MEAGGLEPPPAPPVGSGAPFGRSGFAAGWGEHPGWIARFGCQPASYPCLIRVQSVAGFPLFSLWSQGQAHDGCNEREAAANAVLISDGRPKLQTLMRVANRKLSHGLNTD